MIDDKQIEQGLQAYLSEHFDAVELVAVKRMFSGDGTAYLFKADDEKYELRVMDEITDSIEGNDELHTFLTDFNTASVMRDLVGFPITISLNGCVFEDF